MNILANDGISPSGAKALQDAGHTLYTEFVAAEHLEAFLHEKAIDGVLVRSATKIRRPLIDACPGLKFIGRGGVGMDNIDVEYARGKGLTVFNTPAASSQSVAELVMGHLFSVARFLADSNRNMPTKGHDGFKTLKKAFGKGTELRGKTLGIVGFGRIGRSLASYALGCGMKVVAHDPFVDNGAVEVVVGGQTLTIECARLPLMQLLAQADMVSVHVPAQADGSAMIGTLELEAMKPHAFLVNAARGGSVDEDALLAALDAGTIAGAALDVFVGEPAPRQDVLAHPKLALTPHIGAATAEAQDRIGLELAAQIQALA